MHMYKKCNGRPERIILSQSKLGYFAMVNILDEGIHNGSTLCSCILMQNTVY